MDDICSGGKSDGLDEGDIVAFEEDLAYIGNQMSMGAAKITVDRATYPAASASPPRSL